MDTQNANITFLRVVAWAGDGGGGAIASLIQHKLQPPRVQESRCEDREDQDGQSNSQFAHLISSSSYQMQKWASIRQYIFSKGLIHSSGAFFNLSSLL